MIHKFSIYLLTLVALLTMTTGAWAQDSWTSGDCTVTMNNGTLTVSGNGAMDDYAKVTDQPWKDIRSSITSIVVEEGVTHIGNFALTAFTKVTSVSLPWSLTSIGTRAFSNCNNAGFTSIIIPSNVETIGEAAFHSCNKLTKVNIPNKVTSIGKNAFYGCTALTSATIGISVTSIGEGAFNNCSAMTTFTVKTASCTLGNNALLNCGNLTTINVPSNEVENYKNAEGWSAYASKIQEIPLGTLFLSDDQTEADFDMPSYDATLEYDIVRNLASNTTLNLFIGTDEVTDDARLRIAKNAQTGKYAPVSTLGCELYDETEETTLTAQQILLAGITPQFYLLGENETWTLVTEVDQTTHLPVNIAPYQTYRMVLKANDDSQLYGGETAPSFTITLFEGYEVTVPAGEYITYYKDEALYVENDDVKLYTITDVGTETATATELTVAKANMPILVKNNSTDPTKTTILLIPTTDKTPDDVTAADEFKGTLEATEIAASSATSNNYAFNGLKFVWVKSALAIGANKAWLEIPAGELSAPVLTLVFEDVTAIDEMVHGTSVNGTWYDLNGRKLQGVPTKKGVYIMNGRKVVVK